MTQYLLIAILYLVTVGIFAGFSAVLFFHIRKYSLIGDVSKRMFTIFFFIGAAIMIFTPILIIINNILS